MDATTVRPRTIVSTRLLPGQQFNTQESTSIRLRILSARNDPPVHRADKRDRRQTDALRSIDRQTRPRPSRHLPPRTRDRTSGDVKTATAQMARSKGFPFTLTGVCSMMPVLSCRCRAWRACRLTIRNVSRPTGSRQRPRRGRTKGVDALFQAGPAAGAIAGV